MKRAGAAILLLLIAALAAAFFLFSGDLAGWIVRRSLPYPSDFAKASFAGPLMVKLDGLSIRQPNALIRADTALVRVSVSAPPPSATAHADMRGIAIEPTTGWIRPVRFESGRLRVVSGVRSTQIKLSEWDSSALKFNGEAELDGAGELHSFWMRGRADPAFFKSYITDEFTTTSDAGEWPPFLVRYADSSLEIQLNDKTIFRSSWVMRKSVVIK